MNAIVFFNEHTYCVLTTESAASQHGIPVLRVRFADPKLDATGNRDLGPADMLPSGVTAASLVCSTYWGMNEETRDGARRFCRQWPDGPQPEASEPITNLMDPRLPQPPYDELPVAVIARLNVLQARRSVCPDYAVARLTAQMVAILLPFRHS